MKIFLAFFIVMGIIVTLGDAGCAFERRQPWWPQKGCRLKGKLYPLGHIERTENCDTCDCMKDGIHCCSVAIILPHYDAEKCKIILHKKHCKYDVVQKDDPSKECSSFVPLD